MIGPGVKKENSDGAVRSTGENLTVTGSKAAEGLPSGLGTRRVELHHHGFLSSMPALVREEQMSKCPRFLRDFQISSEHSSPKNL